MPRCQQVTATSQAGTALGGVRLMGSWVSTYPNLAWPYAASGTTATATTSTSTLGIVSFRSPQITKTTNGCAFVVANATVTGYILDPLKTPASAMTSATLSW